jgi:hypothetical protein
MLLFAGTVLGLSISQRSFMTTLGWHPVTAPTFDWPSGLALGPYGRVLTVVFVLSGGGLAFLSWALSRCNRLARVGGMVAALGMTALAFDTDPTLTTRIATWHGRLHDLGYITLGGGLAALMLGLCRTPASTIFRLFTVLCLLAMIAGFVLKGFWFYGMLVAMIVWICVNAVRLTGQR